MCVCVCVYFRRAKQGPSPSLREQGVCKSKGIQNTSCPVMVLPQDLPQLFKPTELPLVPPGCKEQHFWGGKASSVYPHSQPGLQTAGFPHTSFLQEQGPQRLLTLSRAGDA